MMYKLFIFILLLLLHRIKNLSGERVSERLIKNLFRHVLETKCNFYWIEKGEDDDEDLMVEDFLKKVSVEMIFMNFSLGFSPHAHLTHSRSTHIGH